MAPAAGADDREVNQSTVFVDTSLDTHLVTRVSDSDTVSDFKNRIMLEHRQCFPAIGDINIECLKVKQRGIFYRLSDSMLIKSAFANAKKNWFVSVDASRLERDGGPGGTRQLDERKAGDQLALPWVTDRPSNLFCDHGSPSIDTKTVPYVNQKVCNVDQLTSGDSCRDISRKIEEDRSSDGKKLASEVQEKLHAVNKNVKSKKRTRDVCSESLHANDSVLGQSVKKRKKHKSQVVKINLKAPEENVVLTYDSDKVKDKETSINNENFFQQKSKVKDLSDENTRNNKGENFSNLDQVEDVGKEMRSQHTGASETVADVAMIVKKNIQQEIPFDISQKENDNELVEKAVINNEMPSSLMRSSVIKNLDTINKVAIDSSLQQDVGSTVQESAGDQINKNMEDNEISLKQGAEVKLSERKMETVSCENTVKGKGKRTKKSAVKKKDESLVKHVAADNLVGDISLRVSAPVSDERNIDGRNEVSEKSLVDSKKGDDVIMKEVEVSEPTENHRSGLHVEEKSKKELNDTLGSSKRKKSGGKSASRNDKSVMKHTNDAETVTNEEKVLSQSERKESLDILSRTGENVSQVNAENQNEKTADSKKKKRTIKKSARKNENESMMDHAAGDVSMPTAVSDPPLDGELHENAKEGESYLPNAGRKDDGDNMKGEDAQIFDKKFVKIAENTKRSSVTNDESALRNNDSVLKHANDAATVTNGQTLPQSERKESLNILSRTGESVSQVNADGILDNSHKQNDKLDDSKKKKRKTKKSERRNDDEPITKHANSDFSIPAFSDPPLHDNAKQGENSLADADKVKEKDTQIVDEGLMKVAKNNKKSSMTAPLDVYQSTEFELEPDTSSRNIDNVIKSSQASKVRMEGRVDVINEVSISKDGSHEIDFMDYFVSGHQPNKITAVDNGKDTTHSRKEKKPKKKTKDSPIVQASPNTSIQSQKFISKSKTSSLKVSDVVKDPKGTRMIDVKKGHGGPSAELSPSSESLVRPFHNQKSNKQQSIMSQTHVKAMKKTAADVKSTHQVKSLLNTPGTIFADYSDKSSADDNASVNSDSSTRTPSRKKLSSSSSSSSTSSSSSSGERDSILHSRKIGSHAMKRNEVGGKNTMSTQSKSNRSIADLLRSSSRFKKARVTASQLEDTESQPVDFVPDSQPMAKS